MEELENKVKVLNLKDEKDFKEFINIAKQTRDKYKEELKYGREEHFSIIIDKILESFPNITGGVGEPDGFERKNILDMQSYEEMEEYQRQFVNAVREMRTADEDTVMVSEYNGVLKRHYFDKPDEIIN